MEEITEILKGTLLDYSNLVRHSDDMYKIERMQHRLQWLKENSCGRIIEVGCATGYVLNYVNGHVGIDTDRERLKVAKTRCPNLEFYLCDAQKIDFPDKFFDTVLLPEILEHMPFDKSIKVFEEAVRLGNCVIFTVPKAGGEEDRNKNPEHFWLATDYEVKQLMKERKITAKFESDDFFFIKINSSIHKNFVYGEQN